MLWKQIEWLWEDPTAAWVDSTLRIKIIVTDEERKLQLLHRVWRQMGEFT